MSNKEAMQQVLTLASIGLDEIGDGDGYAEALHQMLDYCNDVLEDSPNTTRRYVWYEGKAHRVGVTYDDGTALLYSVTVMGAGTNKVPLNECRPLSQEDAEAIDGVEPHLLLK